MAKPHVTRTFGSIHFEDLDPHRFEDLIRQLVYDMKQWQSIESTGRGGADDGFDVRAYEAQQQREVAVSGEDSDEEAPHPMEGNLWMIQCKRERNLGPTRVQTIIKDEVKPENPPYGYILAAPTHFSKAAHDKFREELRSRGVMEFYLWGAGELEDMLYQPKNDHILFGFFGISLVSRRRSKTTTIRSTVAAKNKLLRVLGDEPRHRPILLRDLNDDQYPFEDGYNDFEKRPRWKMFDAVEYHPLGIVVAVSNYYAYLDKLKGELDYSEAVNLAVPVDSRGQRRRGSDDEQKKLAVKGFWEQLPHANRIMLTRCGLVRFDSIDFIDEKGDGEFNCPHIFVDFQGERRPFWGTFERLEFNEHHHEYADGLKRVKVFPEKFKKPTFGVVHKDRFVTFEDRTRAMLQNSHHREFTIYDVDGKYGCLKPTDVIGVDKGSNQTINQILLKITNVRTVKGRDLIDAYAENPPLKYEVESQISREVAPDDSLRVIEAKVISDWQIEQNRPVV
ncbi:restriction endonuclease [Burkholderia sp. R-69980]|nr:restriction endonuclease [Burkholderia sp. R-69980]